MRISGRTKSGCNSYSRSRRIAAGLIGFLMLFAILFFSFYIAAESHHDCCGEDCEICACMEQCGNALHEVRDTGVAQTAAAAFALLLLFQSLIKTTEIQKETLVSQKIRLNN